jgi:hypothetical protein
MRDNSILIPITSRSLQIDSGELLPNSGITFDKAEDSLVNLVGKSKG